MERKYQLVAWTRNITDKDNARVLMVPSLEHEMQLELIDDIGNSRREESKNIRALEKMAWFKILTGHYSDGVRHLIFAARRCKRRRHELVRLFEEARKQAREHRCEHVLQEDRAKEVLEMYLEGFSL